MFTWTDACDPEIMNNGVLIAMTDAGRMANQQLVKTISNDIGHKLDWHYAGGIGVIKCLPEHAEAAKQAIAAKLGTFEGIHGLQFCS